MSKEKASVSPKPSSPAFSVDPRYVGRITGILLAICLIVSLLLGVVNQITKPLIDASQKAKQDAAMAQVLAADSYEKLEFTTANVTALYKAVAGGAQVGWVAETSTSGSQGAIQMMVGVDIDSRVTGVSIVKHSETPNIGTKVVGDQSVLDRFIGMSHADGGEITVNTGTNRFDGVTGATYSSKGAAAGVNAALTAVSEYLAQGGQTQ